MKVFHFLATVFFLKGKSSIIDNYKQVQEVQLGTIININ